MSKVIRIGTRDSELALWQANTVSKMLNDLGVATEIVAVKSQGDLVLDKPLYEMGITGIFTKTLDIAMLQGQVDIAVHSMKDVPTALPQGIVQAAVLKRASAVDLLLHKGDVSFLDQPNATIATGSLRRKAQWLHKYPGHTLVDLRGNVNTRMQKLQDNPWHGAVFAAAGLDRIEKKPENSLELTWMVPAPAQGAMVVVALAEDDHIIEVLRQLNDFEAEMTTHIERQFLRTLEGGCSAPIGAHASYDDQKQTIRLHGVLLSIDGKQRLEYDQTVDLDQWKKLGFHAAKELLSKGGDQLMSVIKDQLK